jgi:hypothetical protein
MKYKIMILIVIFISLLSGCVGSTVQPMYYDEKARYLMADAFKVIKNDILNFAVAPSLLEMDSQNYYTEIDKLIVSPKMQPAVDEFKRAMKEYHYIAYNYNTRSRTCQIPDKVDVLVKIYNQCMKDQSELNNETTQGIYDTIVIQVNSNKLLPDK